MTVHKKKKTEKSRICEQGKLELSIGDEQPLKDFRPRYKRGQRVQVNCVGITNRDKNVSS